MALLDFPSGPGSGDTYTLNGNTWKWNGTSWTAFNSLSLSSQVTGILAVQYGGTGFGGTYTVGDILYASSSNAFTKLSAGTAGSVLASGGPAAAPYWKVDDTGAGTVGSGTSGGFAYYNSSSSITSGSGFSYISSSTPTVVLTNGNLSLTGSTVTSGTWAGGAITAKYGGTGLNALSAGDLIYGSSTDTYSRLTHSGAAGSVLVTVGSSGIAWTLGSTLSVGTATSSATVVTDATTSTRYLVGTVLNTASSGGTVLSTGSGITIGNNTITAITFVGALTGTASIATSVATTTDTSNNLYLLGSRNSTGVAATAIYVDSSVYVNGSTITATTFSGNLTGTASIASSSVLLNTTADTTNTLYLLGTRTNGGFAGTAIYVDTGISALGNTITATTFSGALTGTASTSTTAINLNTYSLSGTMYLIGQANSSGATGASQFVGSGISFNSTSGLLTATSYAGSGILLSGIVTSLTAGNGIQVSSATGNITVSNIGVTTITGTANRITVSSSIGSSNGAITLNLPQDIATNSAVTFDTVSVRAGTLSTTSFSNATDIVNKQYVDNLASGLDIHASVRLIATSGLGASYVQSSIGGSSDATGAYLISATQVALPAIDSITISATGVSQRILVAGGITGKVNIGGTGYQASTGVSYLANGIYYVTALGGSGSNWILTRALDTDTNTELTAGTFTFVEEGTSYGDTGWVCTNDTTNLGPIGFGITQINFSQFTGAAAFNTGQGITKVGNTIATNVNLSSSGTASGTGFTQFNIGGASVGGVADTGYYPTFSVRTSSTIAGSALLTLNNDGFSLIGSTGTNRTITITGGDITLNGGGNTLTLTGNISLPTPQQYRLAWGVSGTAISFLPAGTASSVLFQTNNTSDPIWVGQSTLVVGGASTSANIQGGGAGSIVYNSGSNTTTFLSHSGAASSVLVTTGTSGLAWTVASTLSVGTAISSASVVTDATTSTRYLVGTVLNTASSGGTVLSTGSGITIGNNTITAITFVGALTGTASIATSVATTTDTSNNLYLLGSRNSTGVAATAIYVDTSVYVNGSTITATTFSGNLTGTASIATSVATTADTSNNLYLLGSRNSTGVAATAIYVDSSVYVNGSTITATTFSGNLTGTASIASSSVLLNTTADTTNTLYLLGTRTNGGFAGTAIYVDTGISALGNTITATTFSGVATSATRVGITTSVSTSDLPIVFADAHQPYAALGSSTLLTYQASTGKITNGIWAGTAITTRGGGTGFNTVNANQVLMGAATGNTWAAVASTNIPVVGIGSVPPSSPGGAIGNTQAGQLWWDSTYGVLKVYYVDDTPTSQWVDATPVLGSSGGGSSTKRSYVMTFGAGFTPSTGADTVQILIPYAPDNTSKYYYIKRLDYRAETAGTGVSFYVERFTGGNAAFSVSTGNRIHSASGASFVASSGTFITSYTLASSGASFVSSSGVAGSIISGDYLRLNFSHINSAATMSVSMVIEEQ